MTLSPPPLPHYSSSIPLYYELTLTLNHSLSFSHTHTHTLSYFDVREYIIIIYVYVCMFNSYLLSLIFWVFVSVCECLMCLYTELYDLPSLLNSLITLPSHLPLNIVIINFSFKY